MVPARNPETMKSQSKRWYWLVIVVAIAGISCSLATRTFRLSVSNDVSVHGAASQGMRQHLDRDAVRWTPPVEVSIDLETPTFYPRVAPAGPPLPGIVLDDPLYNRPPPSAS
jgi:hypothetical protein